MKQVKTQEGVAYINAPKSEGDSDPIVIPTVVLDRFEKVETSLDSLKEKLGIVRSTNQFINVVLFLVIIGLVLAAIYGLINSIKSDLDSRSRLTDTVNELKVEVEVLRRTQERNTQNNLNTTTQTPIDLPLE